MEAVKQCLAEAADVNAKNKYGMAPLHYAARNGRKGVVELLIAKGAKVNERNIEFSQGWTPMHYAAFYGQKEIVEPLVIVGAQVNAKDIMNRTPLDLAVLNHKKETADLLRKHGAETSFDLYNFPKASQN